VAYVANGNRIVTGGADRTLRFWDAKTLTEHFAVKLDPQVGEVRVLASSPDGRLLATGWQDGRVRLWNTSLAAQPGLLQALGMGSNNRPITALAFAPDGSQLAAGMDNGIVRVWTIPRSGKSITDEPLSLRHDAEAAVAGVAFAADGQTLVTAGREGNILLWDVKNGTKSATIGDAHKRGVTALAVTADGKTIASTGLDQVVRFWNSSDGTEARPATLTGQRSYCSLLSYSPSGKELACVSLSANQWVVRLWDLDRAEPVELVQTEALPHEVRGVAFAPDGRTLATVSDHTLRLWDMRSGKELATGDDKKACDIMGLAFTRDRDRPALVTAGLDRKIRVWEFIGPAPAEATVVPTGPGGVDILAVSADGKRLATGGASQATKAWDLSRSPPDTTHLTRNRDAVYRAWALAMAPDGKTIAGAVPDNQSRVWVWHLDGGQWRERAPLVGHTWDLISVAMAPDGRRVASGDRNSAVRLWNLDTGKSDELFVARDSNRAWVRDVAFSPDGKRLAAAFSDGNVRLWDVSGVKAEVLTPISESGFGGWGVVSVSFGPEGRYLAGALDGRVVVWDTTGHKRVWDHELPGVVMRVAFAPDGRHLATLNGNGTVYIFRLPAGVAK
jgi:WD40 repeat protein